MKSEELQLRVFDWIRFPLIVCVVFLHSTPGYIVGPDASEESIRWLGLDFESFFVYTKVLFQEVLTKVAVPGFFFISGYLFFYKTKEYTVATYKYKLRRRLKSLLIPYLLWNTIAISYPISLYFFRGVSLPDSIVDWLMYYWDADDIYNLPLNYPLWYIRDLMVVSVLSPIIWGLCKKGGWLIMVTMAVLYLCKIYPSVTGLGGYVAFFFTFGAFLSIRGYNILTFFSKVEYPSYFITIALLVLRMISFGRNPELCSSLLPFYCISSLIAVFNLSGHVFKSINGKTANLFDYLKDRVFFVYATHTLVFIIMIDVVVKKITLSMPNAFLFVIYLLMPFVKISVCILIYNLLKSFVPKLLKVLNGGK